jgi:uncharacterized membrane protein YuzA (DUF378 family)
MIMQDFILTLIGELSIGELLAYFVLGMMGAMAYMLFKVSNRYKSDNGKPDKWSWGFFWRDNFFRMGFTFIIVFSWAVFGNELTSFIPENFATLGKMSYFLIGLGTDFIVDKFVKKMRSLEVKV